MKKLTAILGLAAALSLAGCYKDPRAQLIKEIETNRMFSAEKYAQFGNGGLLNISNEEKGFVCRDYCINGVNVMATFNLEPKGTTTPFKILEQGERVIKYGAREVIIFPKDFDYKNNQIITYSNTTGRSESGLDTKKTLTVYTTTLTYKKDNYMEVIESLDKK